jgi:N-methylhydantoinase A
MRHDRVQTVNRMLDDIDVADLDAQLRSVADSTEALLRTADIDFAGIERIYEFDMLYLGQTHAVSVPITLPEDGLTRDTIRLAFESAYREAYGRLLPGIPMRVMSYRVAVVGRRPSFDMTVFAPKDGRSADACLTGRRQVYADGQHHETAVYERLELAVDVEIAGPALLEQPDTTIFVDPGLRARVDAFGNLIIEVLAT